MRLSVSRVRRLWWNLRTRGGAVRRAHGIGLWRQLAQMVWYWRRLDTHDAEYYDYRLFDLSIPLEEKLTYLSSHRWLQWNGRLNPKPARRAVNDKLAFRLTVRQHGLPCLHELGVVQVVGQDEREVGAQLARLLPLAPSSGLVVKPTSGTDSGRGILVFRSATPDGRLRHVDGSEWTLDRLARAMAAGVETSKGGRRQVAAFAVEPRLEVHASLAALCPVTFSTCRIVTLLDGDDVALLGAVFKLGVGSQGIDNYARQAVDRQDRGSIAVFVDLDTGVLGRGCREFDDTVFEAHPETGVRFLGVRLPHWEEACALAIRAARIFPDLLTLGWDVGFTDDGPVILEANPHWAEDLIQRPSQRGLWRPPLRTACERIGRR